MPCACRRHALGLCLAACAPDRGGAAAATSDLSLVTEPDGALSAACLEHLTRVSGPVMVRHCRRTFQFGMALAVRAGARPNREILHVASLLHDLGLEAAYDGPGDFETNGARAATELLTRSGGGGIAPRVAEAIELHTAVASAEDARPEVAYLHMGAVMDVTGARLDLLPPTLVERLVEEFPRTGTKALLAGLLGRQIRQKPDSRIGRLAGRVDVLGLVKRAPFAE